MKSVQIPFNPSKNTWEKHPFLTNPRVGVIMYLYLAFIKKVTSTILMMNREGRQQSVYYVSHSLIEAQKYTHDKAAFIIRTAFRKLRHYFIAHKIVV